MSPLALQRPPRRTSRAALRASLLDGLFGEGHVMPGGAEEIGRLAEPIGLSGEHRLLLVGAGTGGPVLSLAGAFGCGVDGFEADRAFAELAAGRIAAARAGARVAVAPWSADAPAFERQGYDHALALAPLGGAPPDRVLGAIAGALRPGGHLVLLEMVAGSIGQDEDRLASWLKREGRAAAPPDVAALTGLLERLGFEVRIVEDATRRTARLAMAAWRRLLQRLERRPDAATAAVLVEEAERWLSCSELMRSGRLRSVRWHAVHDSTRGLDMGSVKLDIMVAVQFRNWRNAIAVWENLSERLGSERLGSERFGSEVSGSGMPGRQAEIADLRDFIRAGILRDKRPLPDGVREF